MRSSSACARVRRKHAKSRAGVKPAMQLSILANVLTARHHIMRSWHSVAARHCAKYRRTSLALAGDRMRLLSKPASSAAWCTGEGSGALADRPRFLAGCDTTAATSKVACSRLDASNSARKGIAATYTGAAKLRD
jgi:hypothetical protein